MNKERNNKPESRRGFIKKSVLAAVVAGMHNNLSAFANHSTVADGKPAVQNNADAWMISGFAERDITPALGMEQPGGYGKSFHRDLHDPCKVRAAVFSDKGKRIAIVAVDALMVPISSVDAAREAIRQRCGIPPEAVMISATHSHSSGPTGMVQPGEFDHADAFVRDLAYNKSSSADAGYLRHVEQQLAEAVYAADKSAVESTAGIGRGHEDQVAFNRRFYMKNGLTFTHPGQLNPDIIKPAAPIDPEVGVIGAWDQSGKCIGCIVNYTCHTTTNPGGISANWVYYLEQTIRGAMGQDCVVVFLQGAAGDVTQVNNLNPDTHRKGEDWARFVGARVGAEAVKVLLDMPRGVMLPLDYRSDRRAVKRRVPSAAHVRQAYELARQSPADAGQTRWLFAKETVMLDAKIKQEPTAIVEVQVLQIGPAVFVTNPAEFFCELGLDIKAGSPFPYTFVVMLANGCVGYVPTEKAFQPDGGGYETRLTLYSNLEITAGTQMVKTGLELARQLTPGAVPQPQKAGPFRGTAWEYGSLGPQLD